MPAGIREQLAAAIIEGQDRHPGPELVIHGAPTDWSVCVSDNTQEDCRPLWLGAARTPTVIRRFKSLDAAFAAAVDIAKLTDPALENQYARVRVTMALR